MPNTLKWTIIDVLRCLCFTAILALLCIPISSAVEVCNVAGNCPAYTCCNQTKCESETNAPYKCCTDEEREYDEYGICSPCNTCDECTWADWGTWTYPSCGDGSEPKTVTGRRHRKHAYAGNGAPCLGDSQEYGTKDCPEHCQLNDLGPCGPWTNKEQSCGSCTRTQTIKKLAKHGGDECNCDPLSTQTVNAICTTKDESVGCPG